MNPVLIVGGGISGIATAWYLHQQGIPSIVAERESRLGGVIYTEEIAGCQIEWGPDSYFAVKPAAGELIRELGLSHEIVTSNDSQRVTYLWKHDRLIPFPEGMQLISPTKIGPVLKTPLISWSTKIRMGLDYFRRPPKEPLPDRTVADLVRDHYGQEAVDYIAEPLLAGVYGGDPELLSAQSVLPRFVEFETRYGSLTRGTLGNPTRPPKGGLFQTLRGGMGQMITALWERLEGHVHFLFQPVTRLEPAAAGYRAHFAQNEAKDVSAVVLACRTWQAAPLIESFAPTLAELLNGIPYSSALTVALGYDRAQLDHPLEGFGFLVPKRHRKRVLATTWVGTKWPHRIPSDKAVIRCFLGGNEDAIANEPDNSLIAVCREELREKMGIDAAPVFTRISRWPRSMPQYVVGHQARMDRIESELPQHPALFLAGNAYDGVGVPDCIRQAKATAARIAANLKPQPAA